MEDKLFVLALLFALLACGVLMALAFYELNSAWRELSALTRAIRNDDAEARDE